MPIYLGLDASTQSITATAISIEESRRSVLLTRTFRFDDALPQYGTRHGVLEREDPRVVHAPPLMWADALEIMLRDLTRDRHIDWNELRAISGSAQQHGSVYLDRLATGRLESLDPAAPLHPQLANVFSRPTSPVWMDSSTSEDCRAIEAALGGPSRVAALTGSRAFERFTGPQIRKFAREQPADYARTDRIHLVSSFMASLLAGRHAPLDRGDASGMNLMDLTTGAWSAAALDATAPGLASRLPPIVESWAVVGSLARFWTSRFALPPARIVAWSGDNPCSLVGTGLVREGRLAVSLGTSDTIFGVMDAPRVSADGTGHVFASPTGAFMGMTVFKNGSLARERVRDECGLDWDGFSRELGASPPGNNGAMMLPWFEPEITPSVLPTRVHRLGFAPDDRAAYVRALVEAQMMAMALHGGWMGVDITEIRATGGAAANAAVLQVMADVFGRPVSRFGSANSAALGAALRAWHADALASGVTLTWEETTDDFTRPMPGTRVLPMAESVATYRGLLERYRRFEEETLRGMQGNGRH